MRRETHNNKITIDIIVIVIFLTGIYFFNSFLDFGKPADYPAGIAYAGAEVVEVIENNMGTDPEHEDIEIGRQRLLLKILSGPYAGKRVEVYNYVERTLQLKGAVGTEYIIASYDGFITAMVINYNRIKTILFFLGLFLLTVVVLGKRKGIKSVFSLALTLICVFYLLIPLILKGINPILAAVIVVILSSGITFYAVSGISKKSLLALCCCIICCGIAGLYGCFFSRLANVTSLNTQEAENLLFITEGSGLHIQNLLIAGLLIASMGAIMDTSMSMITSLSELRELNPQIGTAQLVKSGFRIGSDIMGTMTNTLILAFAGGSINTLLVLYMYQSPAYVLLNSDLIVIELVRGLAGSIAVVLAIPVSVGLMVMDSRGLLNKFTKKKL